VRAAPGFLVIATQNPKEFVATSHLSEAILDRFELVVLKYQSEDEEVAIVSSRVGATAGELRSLALASVRLARLTRGHARIRRGASVRAALSTAEIGAVLLRQGLSLEEAFAQAALMALPTRIEIEREGDASGSGREEAEELVRGWARDVLEDPGKPASVKKKP
jgi:MoxR-like ATPase